ncbi:sugar ABC transporter ATP-binding protein [Streptomyces sp. ISID311]|uniref:sugar ABC transporter ATP-binding protein n=1 Tax=Streptomyces sp. ISID311 TaxID=2601673 RepID=UPI0011BD4416|nr:sugar ABC transporter ATP-binding protein [Streptomyces sp. ISID311]TXC93535.1 sugar ABC transporter ATP-binding protein [Streptomyces sp. ISID311]
MGAETGERPAAVHAEGIVKRYGPTVALDGARLTVRPGEAHALVGRNGAGKSTLVSVLTGMARPDAGHVTFDGAPAPAWGDTAAWQRRVACVHQKSMTVPELTVAENLYLGRFPGGRTIRWRALRERARALLAEYGVEADPAARIKDLGVEQRQFVEIARALSCGARLIVLDEPTARLDARGIARLFGKLRALRDQGVAFLFISHHLQEVHELCDTVTVFRDARHVLTAPVPGLAEDALVAAMTGEEAGAARQPRAGARTAGEAVLRTEGLAVDGHFAPLDLTVRGGEVVGLAGAAAGGGTAIGRTLAGLRAPDAGRITVHGRPVRTGSVPHALDAGIGYVPEDRHREGLVPGRSVAENATLTVAGRLGPLGTVLPSRTREFARRMIAALDIKATGPGQPVSGLSGGNQQKVVVARALARDPAVLVAVRPTNGVDVRSKEALLGVVREVADRGSGAVIVSDELDDLRICDRVLAVFHGRVTAEFAAGWHDHELVAAMEGMTGTGGSDGPPDAGGPGGPPAPGGPPDTGRPAAPDHPATDGTEGTAP